MTVHNERYEDDLRVDKAQGCHIWVNGRKLVDFCLGCGTHLFGHAPEFLAGPVLDQFRGGTLYTAPTRLAEEYAEEFAKHVPFNDLVFCNTGSEAVIRAFRIARAYTGWKKIALFHGYHHGSYLDPDVVVAPQDESFADVLDGHDLAMAFVEPLQGSNPQVQLPFMCRLGEYCKRRGILLGFDEIISGFRCPGTEIYGIVPDMATYGKIAGGGFPIGIVAGKPEVMAIVPSRAFMGGTFSANPMSLRAGLEVIRRVTPDVLDGVNGLASRLADSVNARCLRLFVMGVGSMLRLLFMPGLPRNCQDRDQRERGDKKALYSGLLDAGFYLGPNGMVFLSTCHTTADVEALAEALVHEDGKLI